MHPPPVGTVTFLFTDIEGSTQLWERFPDQMADALARHDALLRHAIDIHGGYVFKTVSNAFCAAFDTASPGLAAALAAQRGLMALTTTGQASTIDTPVAVISTVVGGEPLVTLRVRMALHTGAADYRDGDYFGPPLNRVARLLAAGHGGQILVSLAAQALVYDSLPAGVVLRDLGEHRLRDLASPEHVFQVVASDLPANFPPLVTLDGYRTNLPPQLTQFIGREREAITVRHLLLRPEIRLLTLTGPGGTGKTRLSVQVAADVVDHFYDGVYFVNLAPLSDPRLVMSSIAQVLGIREVSGRSLLESLKDFLGRQRLLLILDNFEHLVPAAPSITDLLREAPSLKILVTSRYPLRVQGEHEFAVPPLGLAPIKDPGQAFTARDKADFALNITQYEAVRLFIERAQAVKADFTITNDNAPVVAEICFQLDGLPLAIELAAARVKALTPQAILHRLSRRLRLLTGGARDLPERQQTLRRTIDWSYDLLTDDEKLLFRRLSVFIGGRTLETVEAICGGEAGDVHTLDGLASLVDKSLLWTQEQPDGETRYMMLVTIHEYATEKLEESGEAETMRQHHAMYFLRFVEDAEDKLRGPDQLIWLDRLEREYSNIRAAVHWCFDTGQVEPGLRFVGALGWFWYRHSHITDGRTMAEMMLDLDRRHPGGTPEASISRLHARARALTSLGSMIYLQGYYTEALACHAASLPLYQAAGDRHGEAMAYNNLGVQAIHMRQPDQALSYLETGLAFSRQVADYWVQANIQGNIAYLYIKTGDWARAEAALADALVQARRVEDRLLVGHCLENLGEVKYGQARYDEAETFLRQGLVAAQECGNKELLSYVVNALAYVAFKQARYGEAVIRFREVLEIGQSIGWQSAMATGLGGLACVAERGDATELAVHLLGAMDAVLHTSGGSLSALEQAEVDQARAATRARLGQEAYEAAWRLGGALAMDEAFALALTVKADAGQGTLDDRPSKTTADRPQTADDSQRTVISRPETVTPLRAAKGSYGGLTAREREVAALIAQGLTNDDIAVRLTVVTKTVEKHISNILGKLGFENRAQVAAWAVDKGLADAPADLDLKW